MPVDLRVYPCPEAERIMIAMIIIRDKGTRLITPGLLRDEKAFVKPRENSLSVTVIISLNNLVGLVISYEHDEQCSEKNRGVRSEAAGKPE